MATSFTDLARKEHWKILVSYRNTLLPAGWPLQSLDIVTYVRILFYIQMWKNEIKTFTDFISDRLVFAFARTIFSTNMQ